MFDIKEYYSNSREAQQNVGEFSIHTDLSNIEEDISRDMDSLLAGRFGSLYLTDRYKNSGISAEILYPKLTYPGNRSLIITPDKIRFLLSFYPEKSEIKLIEKIVIRPRYIEIENVELVSLYIARNRLLVLYLTHPFFYRLDDGAKNKKFLSADIQNFIRTKLLGNKFDAKESYKIKAHPLWYIISTISQSAGDTANKAGENNGMEKFFVKRSAVDNITYESLNDISLFYSRHGY